MAKIDELSDTWEEWKNSRPPVVKALCERFPPNLLYKLISTDQRVTIVSYSEGGTLTVAVLGKYNLVDFERNVFGISPDDLVECDLPPADEKVGIEMEEEEVEKLLEMLREMHEEANGSTMQ